MRVFWSLFAVMGMANLAQAQSPRAPASPTTDEAATITAADDAAAHAESRRDEAALARLAPDLQARRKASDSGTLFPEFVRDPRLPTLRTAAGTPVEQWWMLTGVGVREKVWFNVYTVGLYLDPLASHHLLVECRGKAGKLLAKATSTYTALAQSGLPKMLRLVMNRRVDSTDMSEAFDDSLMPRIKRASADLDAAERAAGLEALAEFRKLFEVQTRKRADGSTERFGEDSLEEGSELRFHFRPGGRLEVTIHSLRSARGSTLTVTRHASFRSPLLSDALLDVFVGRKPVSSSARSAFARGLPAVLERGAALAAAGVAWQVEREEPSVDAERGAVSPTDDPGEARQR